MAVVTLNPVFRSMKGRIGGIVFYNNNDMLCARIKAIPVNPDTEEQRIVRKTFGDAVRSWQSLAIEDKQKYNKKARRLSKKGYNLYISLYMKNNPVNKDIISRVHIDSPKPVSCIQEADTSVACTFLPICRIYPDYIKVSSRSSAG